MKTVLWFHNVAIKVRLRPSLGVQIEKLVLSQNVGNQKTNNLLVSDMVLCPSWPNKIYDVGNYSDLRHLVSEKPEKEGNGQITHISKRVPGRHHSFFRLYFHQVNCVMCW